MGIRAWDDVDCRAMVRRMRAIAFDLDNTLASSRQPMEPGMVVRFTELTRLLPVAVVTGGRYGLVVSQVLDVLGKDADLDHLHLMPTSGTRYYRWRDGAWRLEYAYDLSDADLAAAVASLERRARQLGLWEERIWGERIENRGSQITFSALGQGAPEAAKRAWDPDESRKRRLAAAVAADLPHLKVRPGGYTSIDISLPGMDKSYAVRRLADSLGIGTGDIVFVGDRMTPGGNDYPAAQTGAEAVSVSSPSDTIRLLDGLLPCLRGRVSADAPGIATETMPDTSVSADDVR
ncbi:HAD-IIB family hydrolase [Bifidobacterium amazonense]|uniref:phosphomannomutase n=1 Tax=Bifidobacterium amazonense TaxID=2809027 RepID=A0ABS9VY32_9BIFI|nr:HAD-IIB family hydrolase [Bifidobacterium amazonense]MCH9276973.1 HAD-IIB family hydrolase [Bifidobacterium amazonense]